MGPKFKAPPFQTFAHAVEHRTVMESNEFDGAMRQKGRVRAPRRRQVQENEDEDSVWPVPGTTPGPL